MKQALRAIAIAVLTLLPGAAEAQTFPQTLPAQTVMGRLGTTAGPVEAIPIPLLNQTAIPNPLPGTRGGTGLQTMQFTGPTLPLKTYTLPNISDLIDTVTAANTLTNKTLTAPTINGGLISGAAVTGSSVTGLPAPSVATDAATKGYVDGVATGLIVEPPSLLATAAILPNTPTYSNGASGVGATLTAGSNTTLTVDGTVAAINNVILVKNQATAANNGIYTVTQVGSGSAPWILTRAVYFNASTNMKAGSYTLITGGTVNINSSFVLAANVVTVGTDPVNFNTFANGAAGITTFGGVTGAVAVGTGLSMAGNTVNGTFSLGGSFSPITLGTGLALAGSTLNDTNTIAGNSGAFTLSHGLTNKTNDLQTFFQQLGTSPVATDLQSKVQQYGPTPQDYGASAGSDLQTTGTISSSSNALSLASAQDYANGQYIRVNHAGAANGVNPVTGGSVGHTGTAGSTTYYYQVASFGATGSVGAAISAVTTTSGNATLSYTNYNTITWTAPAGGTTPAGYAVYGRGSSGRVLLALVPYGTNGWNDYGTAAITAPDWLPSTAPGSALASWLLTTISSGGGTTSLTLGATATTTATSQSVLHDDTTFLQTWLTNCQSLSVMCQLPGGKWRFTSELTVDGGPWGINGQANASTLLYAGANVNTDLIKVGLTSGAGTYRWTGKNFTIDSATQMGGGYCLHLYYLNWATVDGINCGQIVIGTLATNIFNGFYLDNTNYGVMYNSWQQAQNICLSMGAVIGEYLNNINQLLCLAAGTYMGGGNGGIYLGYGNNYASGIGIIVDTALTSTQNYQIFHSIHWIIDTCGGTTPGKSGTGTCIWLNDATAGATSSQKDYIMQGWASGAYATADFLITAWTNGSVNFSGAQIWAGLNGAHGIYVADNSVNVRIDGATTINGNTGYGVYASAPTTKIYSDAYPTGNTSGAYSTDTFVESLGNPGFRRHASGYVDVWGTATATANTDTPLTFPADSCTTTLFSLTGNGVSSGASTSQALSLAFASQSITGFTGQLRLIGSGSVSAPAGSYMWHALCN